MTTLFPHPLSARLRPVYAISQSGLTLFRSPVLVAALWMGMSGIASAHSFTAALLVVGEDREASLAEAVRGFLLAADERDGHANETSDGHLGGVDVHVLPLPRDAAGLVEGLLAHRASPPMWWSSLAPSQQPAQPRARINRKASSWCRMSFQRDGKAKIRWTVSRRVTGSPMARRPVQWRPRPITQRDVWMPRSDHWTASTRRPRWKKHGGQPSWVCLDTTVAPGDKRCVPLLLVTPFHPEAKSGARIAGEDLAAAIESDEKHLVCLALRLRTHSG